MKRSVMVAGFLTLVYCVAFYMTYFPEYGDFLWRVSMRLSDVGFAGTLFAWVTLAIFAGKHGGTRPWEILWLAAPFNFFFYLVLVRGFSELLRRQKRETTK